MTVTVVGMAEAVSADRLVKADSAGVMEQIFSYFAGPEPKAQLSVTQAMRVGGCSLYAPNWTILHKVLRIYRCSLKHKLLFQSQSYKIR